jgi:tetratricopeptide (TPR) repeat protein
MLGKLRQLIALALFPTFALAHTTSKWTLTRNQHFEIYSQASDRDTGAALVWFEQLYSLFRQQIGPQFDGVPPVRIIAFRSAEEYAPYRLRATSDAYFVGAGSQNYIVMPRLGSAEFPIAAHEYTHLALHAAGLSIPLWLNEGLAELFSTVRIGERASSVGANLPARSDTLRRHAWVSLGQLVSATSRSSQPDDRDAVDLFYAESWALTDMLVLSPEYSSRFQALIAELNAGVPSSRAITDVYGKPLETIVRDLHVWVGGHLSSSMPLAGIGTGLVTGSVQRSAASPFAIRLLTAEVLMGTGQLDRAEALYRDLEKESPSDGNIAVALGEIALQKNDDETARREWKRALDLRTTDATLCFQYAVLADKAGVPSDEIRPALARAIALKPDFDDARYRLALLDKSAGRYELALAGLRAMHVVAPSRAFAYWSAIADSSNELDRRAEAQAAAQKAREYASTAAEHAQATQLLYIAQTDIATEFTRDSAGRQYLTTKRVPHDSPDRNPFIEPGDRIRRVQAALNSVDCSGGNLAVSIETAEGPLKLSIPDPSHVEIDNGPAEFTCGAQSGTAVTVDYAVVRATNPKVDGIVRGMRFKTDKPPIK